MRRLVRSMPTVLLLVASVAWLAPPAESDGPMGGLPQLADDVDVLRGDVLSLVARSPDCPCYDADALRALEPVICEHETLTFTGKAVGSNLTAGPFDEDPVYSARAELTIGGFLGFCQGLLGFQSIAYEQAKRCGRLIEETLGPCAEVPVAR